MTNTKFICIDDHRDVQDTSPGHVMAAPLVTISDNITQPNQEMIKVEAESLVAFAPNYEMHATLEEENSNISTFEGVQRLNSFFLLSRAGQDLVVHVRDICFIETSQRILIRYYFSRPRPLERPYVNMFQWWKLLCLKDTGWGPPPTLIWLLDYHICRDVKGRLIRDKNLTCLRMLVLWFVGQVKRVAYTSISSHSRVNVKAGYVLRIDTMCF